MKHNNVYKSLGEYNNNRLLVPRPDITCKSHSVYDSYNRQMYGITNRDVKGQVRFVYTPESDSSYKNRRC